MGSNIGIAESTVNRKRAKTAPKSLSFEDVAEIREAVRLHVLPALRGTRRDVMRALTILVPHKGGTQRRITFRALTEGVFDHQKGYWVSEPVPASESTIRRAMRDLEDMNLIRRWREGTSQAWTFQLIPGIIQTANCIGTIFRAIVDLSRRLGDTVSRAGARILAAKAAKSADPATIIGGSITNRGGVKMEPHKDNLTPFSSANAEERGTHASEGKAMLPERRKGSGATTGTSLPERRNAAPARAEEAAPETGADWKSRTARVRRRVEWDEINAPVLQEGLRQSSPAAEPTPAAEQAEPATGLTGIIRQQLSRAADNVRRRVRSKSVKVEDLESVWRSAVQRSTGAFPPAFTPKDRGRLKHILKSVPLPDNTATWASIIDWLAEQWGTANAIARPKAFEYSDNIDKIIRGRPAIYHLLNHPDAYVDAYIRLFHGEGMTTLEAEKAENLQGIYRMTCRRSAIIAREGYDNLPGEQLTNAELEDRAVKSARRDERARASLQRREEYRKRTEELRRSKGHRARQAVNEEIRAHRVREGWERNIESEEFAHMKTVDMTDYMDD